MEENEQKEIIYDLENAEGEEELRTQSPDISEASESSDSSENSDNSDVSENSDNDENADNNDNSDNDDNSENIEDPANEEIKRMVEAMGAETLLEIIRDNRNAAIRQIISEVEASQVRVLPSGDSASIGCTSIFDLAALA